jgi:hypothetical protein
LVEDVVFCGITTRYPSIVPLVVGGLLVGLGIFANALTSRLDGPTRGFLVAVGVVFWLWYYTNRTSVLVVNSANGSLSESVRGHSDAAEKFITLIQSAKLEFRSPSAARIASA